jgi:hypothetical protein
MRYIDSKGDQRVLTREQSHYLREGGRRQLQYGWGGYKSTLSVRLLEARGLVLVQWSQTWPRWTITGLTKLGQEVLERWEKREALRNFLVPPAEQQPEPQPTAALTVRLLSVERFVQVPVDLMAATIETLERVGCQFDHCPGPDVPPQDMMTCYVCDVLRRLRAES